ncbi:TonB-dependent receptor plug domain-containing protein, partial [Stenotrophomonas sp. A3_2]|uniref:TonB-dependent receptor plug domain-containing protein n=1 Tax=Stenotrophomonas sp. A3_2 TaxID=3119978 RepID=UPI002FC2D893
GVVNTNDLQQAVPSLTIGGQQRSNSQFYLRGQTPGVINQGVHNNSSVTVYFLEVPTLISGPGTFYDMQDVQVLKGPQGTLFGRNTTGGAILFGPVQPKDEVSGYIQGRYGSYNDR